jgi:lysophospholipase L1-like esterase
VSLRRHTRPLGWALILAFPPLLLMGAEGCVRLLGISPRFGREAAVPAWLDRNILVKDARWMEMLDKAPKDLGNYYGTYQWDRYLFYRLRPGVRVALTDVLAPAGIRPRTRWVLDTNASGYRGPDVAPGSHDGIYRILSLGDSSTFGWGVEGSENYPTRLREELRRRHPGLAVEVVNLGVCGYSSFQGKVLLEREGLAYRPDLVTISYGSNDWSRVPEPFDESYRRSAGWSGSARSLLHRSRAYQVYAAFLTSLFEAGWSDRVRKASRTAGGEMPLNVGPEKSRANIISMIETARSAGADPIVVTNCVRDEMARPVLEAAEAAGVPIVDTASLLDQWIPLIPDDPRFAGDMARVVAIYGERQVAEEPGLEVYLADGCHPNPLGHRLLAEALAVHVEESASFRAILEK